MKKGFKLIVPSLLAIIVCVLLLAGSTFALFTSDVTKNIVVGSATVNMAAEYTDFKAYSVEATDNNTSDDYAGEATAYGVTSHYNYVEVSANSETAKTFANKGTATLTDENTIELVNVTPGDRITANLTVTNNSNVDIIYRVRLNAISDNGLLDGLTVKAGGETLTGVIKVGEWTPWTTEQTTVENIALEVFLPVEAGNEYQTKSAILRFTIEAVQANAKADTLLEQVNEYLATHDGNDDGKNDVNNTMYDAIQEVKGNTELAAFDATKYLWSPETDQFYAPYTVVAGFESHFFKAYTRDDYLELNGDVKYGVYAISGGTATWPTSLTIDHSFDAGEVEFTSITYDRHEATTGKQSIVRTNSANTSLTIDAPLDVVHHYGTAGSLTILAVANASYHEFGKAAFVEIKNGRIALESGAEVDHIHLSTSEVNNVTVFNDITVAKASNVNMPEFSRDPVEIPEGGKLVVALQSSTEEEADKDYVWLTAVGIYEQVVVSDQKENLEADGANNSYAANSTDQDKKDTAQQIANNISANVGGIDYTLKAEKTDDGWSYSLESEYATPITEDVTVAVETIQEEKVVTVSVADEVQETTKENGLSQQAISEKKEEVIDKNLADEIAQDPEVANYKARIGKTGYDSFAAALEAIQNGQTIVLLANAEFGSQITISNNMSIDLNGHNLTFLPAGNNSYWGPSVTAFNVGANGTFKLKDSANVKGQFVVNPPYTCTLTLANNSGNMILDGVNVLLDVENYKESVDTTEWNTTCDTNRASVNGITNIGTLNVIDSNLTNASNGGATMIMNYGTLNMQRSVMNLTGNSSSTYGVNANAPVTTNVASINNISNSTFNLSEAGQVLTFTKSIATVSNCTINMSGTASMSASSAYGIYVGKSAIAIGEPEVLINGNTKVTANYSSYGATCISVNAGHVVIEEGTIANAGSNGYALRFGASALSGFENVSQLEVKGGTYTGEINSISKNGTMTISAGTFNGDICLDNGSSTQSTVVITGGTFNGDISATGDYLYTIEENENLHLSYGAQIGSVKYMTLQAAINAAVDNDVIVVLKDSSNAVFAANGKTFTVDLNGHAININNNDTFNVYNDTHVTLTDSSEGQKGSIVTGFDGCSAIWIGSSATDSSSLVINDGITLTGAAHSVCLNNGTVSVTINDAILNGDISLVSGQLSINGALSDHDPTAYLGEGCETYQNNDGKWVVAKTTYTWYVNSSNEGNYRVNNITNVQENVSYTWGQILGNGDHPETWQLNTDTNLYEKPVSNGQAKSGDTIVFADGTYTLSGKLYAPDGVTILGQSKEGTILELPEGLHANGSLTVKNLTFGAASKSNFYFIQPNVNGLSSESNPTAQEMKNTLEYDFYVENVVFNFYETTQRHYGIYMAGCGNLTVKGCTFENLRNAICAVKNFDNATNTVLITGNTFTNIRDETIGYVGSEYLSDEFAASWASNNTFDETSTGKIIKY